MSEILMRRTDGDEWPGSKAQPGAFAWQRRGEFRAIAIRCPHPDHVGVVVIPVEGPQAWQWDGNEDAPTLSPSLLTESGSGDCRYHIFVRAGRMVDA